MEKKNTFWASIEKLCGKDLFVAFMFILVTLQFLGTTVILFAEHQPFFAVVNIASSLVLTLLYLSIRARGEDEGSRK